MSRELKNYFEISNKNCMRCAEPCSAIDCRYHIHSDAKPDQIATAPIPTVTCSLKLANTGGMTLDSIGIILGLTRERVRQIEAKGSFKLSKRLGHLGFNPIDLFKMPRPPKEGEPVLIIGNGLHSARKVSKTGFTDDRGVAHTYEEYGKTWKFKAGRKGKKPSKLKSEARDIRENPEREEELP